VRLRLAGQPRGSPLFRSTFARYVWKPAVARGGLDGFTFDGLRNSFVAILVAAGCNVREVSEWAGHNSVAFTLTRYGGLFVDGSTEAVERLDALLSDSSGGAPSPITGGSLARQVHASRRVRRSKNSR
jgi:integrase